MRVCSLLLLPILVACGAATADAQVHPKARPKPATATPSVSLAGDVYLVMQSGDIKRGAAVEVLLIRDSDHDSLGVLSRRICELVVPLQQEIVDSARVLGDSAKAHPGASSYWGPLQSRMFTMYDSLRSSTRDAMDRAVANVGVVAGRMQTGIDAHYAFPALSPRAYRVRAVMTVADYEYRWWVPVVLAAGGRQTLDLNHLNVADATDTGCPYPTGRFPWYPGRED